MKFRKKPVVIEAIKFDGSIRSADEICLWSNKDRDGAPLSDPIIDYVVYKGNVQDLLVHTLEGDMRVDPNDWVIREVAGEFYPCKPDIFKATYETVDDLIGHAPRRKEIL